MKVITLHNAAEMNENELTALREASAKVAKLYKYSIIFENATVDKEYIFYRTAAEDEDGCLKRQDYILDRETQEVIRDGVSKTLIYRM